MNRVCILAILSIVTLLPVPGNVLSLDPITATTIANHINVREKPGLKAKVIAQIDSNIPLKVTKRDKYEYIDNKKGTWVYIQTQNEKKIQGWVFDAFIAYNYSALPNNKFIKAFRIEKNPRIYEAIFYDKNVVLGLLENNQMQGFCVYHRRRDDPDSYLTDTPIYRSSKNDLANFICILGDCLFVDFGTGPGCRGLMIYDLAKNEIIFDGSHFYPVLGGIWFPEVNGDEVYAYKPVAADAISKIKNGNNIELEADNLITILEEAKSISYAIKKQPGYSPFEYSLMQRYIFNLKSKKIRKTNIYKIVQEQG